MVESGVLDGAPEVDDLVAFSGREECGVVRGREVPQDASVGGGGSLVDMHALNGLAFLWGVFPLVGAAAADSWWVRGEGLGCGCTFML